ncbi:MAG: alkaline phosphatase family protein [Tepidisphaerales bacterium]
MRRLILILVLLVPGAGCRRGTSTPAPAAGPRVVIISIDGLRPDVALRAEMPCLRELMRHGAFSFWARTTELSVTLPSHTSMLTGIVPERHEVYWNYDMPEGQTFRSPYPSVLDLAKAAGYTTALSVGKSKLRAIPGEHAVDWGYVPERDAQDYQVAAEAAKIIHEHRPDLLFVHFAEVDGYGHGSSWGSESQLQAAKSADQGIGTIIAALREAGVLAQTTILVTADHGGAGTMHGPDDPRSRHIPWVICGPNTQRSLTGPDADHQSEHGYDLTRQRELIINTEDTFATVCWLMDIPMPEDVDGKPITAAFNDPPGPPTGSDPENAGRR